MKQKKHYYCNYNHSLEFQILEIQLFGVVDYKCKNCVRNK